MDRSMQTASDDSSCSAEEQATTPATTPATRLFLVPTPIGNMEDITFRAVRILREADRIVAEDTRRTRKLLSHLGLDARRLSRLDANATDRDLDRVVGCMLNHATVALVTDAGTPLVSDPGRALVERALSAGIGVVSLPGPSAVTTAIAASGLVEGAFSFLGYAPRGQAERATWIGMLADRTEPCVLFESPNRLTKTLQAIADAMPNRRIVVAREISKAHEELVRGTVREVSLLEREWVGEVTVVLGPWDDTMRPDVSDDEIDARIDQELAAGTHTKTVAGIVAAWSGLNRRDIYARVIERVSNQRF